jgi:hypothetical protein
LLSHRADRSRRAVENKRPHSAAFSAGCLAHGVEPFPIRMHDEVGGVCDSAEGCERFKFARCIVERERVDARFVGRSITADQDQWLLRHSSPVCHRTITAAIVRRFPEFPIVSLGEFFVELDAKPWRIGHGKTIPNQTWLYRKERVGIVHA